MIGSAFLLLAISSSALPCESLTSLSLADATVTGAVVVPEGPPPLRGAGPGGARGAQGGTTQVQGPAPQAAPQTAVRGGEPPANIPAHCRVQMILKPTSDSLINMELWLPVKNWNGKFMGVGNGGF